MHSYVHAFIYDIILFRVDEPNMVVWINMFAFLMFSNDPLMIPWFFAAYVLPWFNVYLLLSSMWYDDMRLDECYVDMRSHARWMRGWYEMPW